MSRYYMRSSDYGMGCSPTPIVKKLLIINIVAFLITYYLPSLKVYLGLIPPYVTNKYWYWQFFTYMFLHHDFMHILFNMYALLLFGSEVEGALGSRSFLRFYLVTGVGAGIITYLFGINARVFVTGASGAIFGILVAYAMMFPNRIILAFFIIPMRAWQFVIIFGLITLMASISGGRGGGIAHNAHLGGLGIGFLYMRYGERVKYYWRGMKQGWQDSQQRHEARRETESQEYIRREIDPILDKISRSGIHSLTRKEKKKLKDARDRLR